jgi:hypothetical protein
MEPLHTETKISDIWLSVRKSEMSGRVLENFLHQTFC